MLVHSLDFTIRTQFGNILMRRCTCDIAFSMLLICRDGLQIHSLHAKLSQDGDANGNCSVDHDSRDRRTVSLAQAIKYSSRRCQFDQIQGAGRDDALCGHRVCIIRDLADQLTDGDRLTNGDTHCTDGSQLDQCSQIFVGGSYPPANLAKVAIAIKV